MAEAREFLRGEQCVGVRARAEIWLTRERNEDEQRENDRAEMYHKIVLMVISIESISFIIIYQIIIIYIRKMYYDVKE